MATLTGKTLGKYQVGERIGRGGMAEVYKAYHPRLQRDVAIKVLHSYLAEGVDFLARFEREARAIAALRHPHIVQVFDYDVEDEIVYMVMEFISGGSLKARQDKFISSVEYMPLDQVLRVIGEVGEALDYAHAKDMLHRDIKPANILLDRSGSSILTDFGIARIVSDTQFTVTGTLIGTPAYMSPEQGKGDELTPASDLYSLGIILYELLTNQVPFDADTPLGIIHKQVNEPLPFPRTIREDITKEIEAVVLKVLAKDPSDRYPSATEFTDALREAMAGVAEGEPYPVAELKQDDDVDLQPTVIMVDDEDQDEVLAPTVAMDEAITPMDATEVVPEEIEEVISPITLPEEKRKDEPISPISPTPEEAKVVEDFPQNGKGVQIFRSKRLPYLLGAIAVLTIAIILAVSGIFQTNDHVCNSIEECREQAFVAMDQGDFEVAIDRLSMAIEIASPGEHPPFAELWCIRADAYLALDRIDEASSDLEGCIVWTEDDPGLEQLRREAENRLMELRGD
jgi:serine/threonine protein kinase